MNAWILAARPKTLPAAVVPVWVGSMPLLTDGDQATGSWLLFWSTLVSCLCIQIATNLFNDAIDFAKGADTAKRLGPKRATASGLLSRRSVMLGAMGFCLLAVIIAVPLLVERGWPIAVIGMVSLFFAYGYTGGPFPLAYRGMGELFVILFFGFVAVLGSYYVQAGVLGGRSIWILGLQCGLYSSVLIAINNLRDRGEDKGTGKRTMAVRFGSRFARIEIAIFCLVPSFLYPILGEGDQRAFTALFLSLPLAIIISLLIFKTKPGPAYNKYLALGALQLLLFGALAVLAIA
mgnify:CR=1 FL=1|tara:strand:+ start:657 stop:1529 length:873 start_codon:yes stop_codon:yes gene_type:complete